MPRTDRSALRWRSSLAVTWLRAAGVYACAFAARPDSCSLAELARLLARDWSQLQAWLQWIRGHVSSGLRATAPAKCLWSCYLMWLSWALAWKVLERDYHLVSSVERISLSFCWGFRCEGPFDLTDEPAACARITMDLPGATGDPRLKLRRRDVTGFGAAPPIEPALRAQRPLLFRRFS